MAAAGVLTMIRTRELFLSSIDMLTVVAVGIATNATSQTIAYVITQRASTAIITSIWIRIEGGCGSGGI